MSGTSVGDMGDTGDVGPDSRPRSCATGVLLVVRGLTRGAWGEGEREWGARG